MKNTILQLQSEETWSSHGLMDWLRESTEKGPFPTLMENRFPLHYYLQETSSRALKIFILLQIGVANMHQLGLE